MLPFAALALGLVVGTASFLGQAESVSANPGDRPPPWYDEGMALMMRNSAQAQEVATQHLAAARAAVDATAEAYAHLLLGAAHGRLNDLTAMLEHTRLGLAQAERLGAPALVLAARTIRAIALRAVGDHAGAIGHYLQILSTVERTGPRSAQLEALYGLALAHKDLGQLDQALDFARQDLALAEQLEDPAAIASGATALAEIHLAKGNAAEARRLFNRVLDLRRQRGRAIDLADTEESLALLDFRDGHPAEALAALRRVETQRRTLRGKWKLTQALLNQARVLTSLGRADEALARVEEARGYVDGMNSPTGLVEVYAVLATVQEARGALAEAFAALQRSHAAALEVSGESARLKAIELQARYDVVKKDEELVRLARVSEAKAAEERLRSAQLAATAAELRASEATLARTRTQRLALGAGIVGATALLGALVFVQRSRLRAERRALEETRRAQILAEDAGVLKSRLLGIASHDLKGPLRSMLRSADTLEQKATDPAAVRGAAQLVRGHARQMSDLVRDLLDLSAIEGGDLTLQKSPVDLAHLVAEVVARHAARAAEKLQSLSFAPPAAPLPFVGDAARLAQALDNLVDNAVKYTSAGGTIQVTAGQRGTHYCLAIADQGPGLASADFARLFQPFQRLSAQPTGGEASTGLGLHIARDFIARHGGSIEVDTAPGCGTTFTVLLPTAAG